MNWTWEPVSEPAEPMAAVGIGAARQQLWNRLCALPTDQQAALAATANREMLIVLGPTKFLPWTPGIRYIAPCSEAPSLWLPTTHRPNAPIDLLARAILNRHHRSPILLWPDPPWVIPLDRQLPLSAALLERFAEEWG